MTLFWLIIWLCYSAPTVAPWNSWLVALIVCVVIDLGGSRTAL